MLNPLAEPDLRAMFPSAVDVRIGHQRMLGITTVLTATSAPPGERRASQISHGVGAITEGLR